MARLRDEYSTFTSRGAEILAVGPNRVVEFKRYWEEHNLPFVGLPDPSHHVALMYRQEVNLFKLGRMPLSCIVDKKGYIRYLHYGKSMSDIPENEALRAVIDELNAASNKL